MKVRVVEVGPRDGLQNEPKTVPTDLKVAFVDALSDAGYEEIEASAFVSPQWVPQLADAEEVFARIRRRETTVYSALVPNERGLERALSAKVRKVAVFTAASETFNRKNVNASIQESIERFRPVVAGARREKLPVRGYVSTAFWCPYEGRIGAEAVVGVARQLLDLGVDEISIGDTIGKAVPGEVHVLLDLLLDHVDQDRLAMHFHDTYGNAIANVLASYERGIAVFDSSAGGVGGCPFAPGAAGNVATEDLIRALTRSGASLSPDLERVRAASDLLSSVLGRPLRSS
ncbi:MAG: hydroxymethylglutaryl-CoA lyase [Candidatus Eisenbacteria bacterium]|uniref:Hydroxymethylglutaryl-CoA lyase n=1 Tax=Eiseniibacteriota bacterium TaxID=2212470 RepID=A0A538T6E2_UNCEI|nr:MAG: hydroxymethylglutaryl-CoA lyase [Candidatus Eisenbacteria bacterium]